jgi:sulfur carrier protein
MTASYQEASVFFMQIIINGTQRDIPDRFSAAELITSMGLAGKRIALEVNEEIVPRSTYLDYFLSANDRVEIVNAIGGG